MLENRVGGSDSKKDVCHRLYMDDAAVLCAYARVHAFYQITRWVSPPFPWTVVAIQAPFVLAALLCPSRGTLRGCASISALTVLFHLPAVVDMDHWSLHTDVALLFLLAARANVAEIASVLRTQMAIFYAAAAAWKVTVEHDDPRLSCSTLLFVQLLCGWLPTQLLHPRLVSLVAIMAPRVTLAVEMSVAALLLSSARTAQRFGVALALALHTAIMLAPLPLSIADFGAMASSRLVWVAPFAAARALAEGGTLLGSRHSFLNAFSPSLFPAAVAGGVCAIHGSLERLTANVAFCALCGLMMRALWLDAVAPARVSSIVDPTHCANNGGVRCWLPTILVSGAFWYAFVSPVLGLIDVGGCIMFSHVKLHGGCNHLLLPTGLLQHWLANVSPAQNSLGPLRDLAGGVVRVEASTSSWLNDRYPGETMVLQPEPLTRQRLRDVGHAARLFAHPGARNRNLRGKNLEVGGGLTGLGLGLVFNQHSNGAGGQPFLKYTLPALELRSMLVGMRSAGKPFSLTYTRLAGMPSRQDHAAAEAWRATGCGRRVTLREHPTSGALNCEVVDTCAENRTKAAPSEECTPDELALLPPPGWIAHTLLLHNPYPILDPSGRHCGSSG